MKRKHEPTQSIEQSATHKRQLTEQSSILFSLPDEILLLIFHLADPASFLNLKLVCCYLRNLSEDSGIWQNIIAGLPVTTFESDTSKESSIAWRENIPTDFLEPVEKICQVRDLIYGAAHADEITESLKKLDQDERNYCRVNGHFHQWFRYAVAKGLIEIVNCLFHNIDDKERLSLFSYLYLTYGDSYLYSQRPMRVTYYENSPLGIAILYDQVTSLELLIELKGFNYYNLNGDVIPDNCKEVAIDLISFAIEKDKTTCLPLLINAYFLYGGEASCFDPGFDLLLKLLRSDGLKALEIFNILFSAKLYSINEDFLNYVFLYFSDEKYQQFYINLLGLINQWQLTLGNSQLGITEKLIYFRRLTSEYDNVGAYCAFDRLLQGELLRVIISSTDKWLLALQTYAEKGCVKIFYYFLNLHYGESPGFISKIGETNYYQLGYEVILNYLYNNIKKLGALGSDIVLSDLLPDKESFEVARAACNQKKQGKKQLFLRLRSHLFDRYDVISAILTVNGAISPMSFVDKEGNTLLHHVWYFFNSYSSEVIPRKYFKEWIFLLLETGVSFNQRNNYLNSVEELANESFKRILWKVTKNVEEKKMAVNNQTPSFFTGQRTGFFSVSTALPTFYDYTWDYNGNDGPPSP